jgi:hypothetical protein
MSASFATAATITANVRKEATWKKKAATGAGTDSNEKNQFPEPKLKYMPNSTRAGQINVTM